LGTGRPFGRIHFRHKVTYKPNIFKGNALAQE
jgi:hypothetical protein